MDDLERMRDAESLRERIILSRELADRDRQLQAALERVRERDRWLEALRSRLTERGLFATWLEAEVNRRDALIGALRDSLARSEHELEVLRSARDSNVFKARLRFVRNSARRGTASIVRIARLLFGGRMRSDPTETDAVMRPAGSASPSIAASESSDDKKCDTSTDTQGEDLDRILTHIPEREDAYDVWVRNNRWSAEDHERARRVLAAMPSKPLFSMALVTASDEEEAQARADLEAQAASNWELRVIRPSRAESSTDNSIEANVYTKSLFDFASGDYLLVLDGGLRLAPDAVFEWTLACRNGGRPALIFADEDRIDARGRRSNPRFRPGWAPDRLLTEPYLGRAVIFRRDLGGRWLDAEMLLEDAWRSELILRVSESGEPVAHCPNVLVHQTLHGSEQCPEQMIRAIECERRAIERSLRRRNVRAVVGLTREGIRRNRPLFDLRFPNDGPRVTILIPTKDRVDLLRRCIGSILERTDYDPFDILILDNGSTDPETRRYLGAPPARCRARRIEQDDRGFNFARVMNQGAAAVDPGVTFILMLNNDTEVLNRDWLARLVGYGSIEGVGFVGARLLYGDGRVQHAGVMPALFEGEPGHALRFSPWWGPEGHNINSGATNIGAVTGACLLARRSAFERLGGFDETRFAVGYNDVDLCLRGWEAGYRTVLASGVELRHLEGASRGFETDRAEALRYRERWGDRIDPLQHPGLRTCDEALGFETRRRRRFAQRNAEPCRIEIVDVSLDPTFGARLERALTNQPARVVQRTRWDPNTNVDVEATIRSLGSANVDVVHVIGAWAFSLVRRARALGLPVVWTIRETVDFRQLYGRLEEPARRQAVEAFSLAYRVVFPSNATRRCYQALETAWNFHVLREGPDLSLVPNDLADGGPRASGAFRVFVCLDGDAEFLRSYCSALGRLARGERSMTVGVWPRGAAARHLKRISVDFPDLDLLEPEERHGALAASDLVAIVARRDLPIEICTDASAMKKAIVASPVSGLEEYLVPNRGAVVVPETDPEALIATINQLFGEESKCRRLGAEARAAARLLPSFHQVAERYLEFHLEAIQTEAPVPERDSLAFQGPAAA